MDIIATEETKGISVIIHIFLHPHIHTYLYTYEHIQTGTYIQTDKRGIGFMPFKGYPELCFENA